MFSEARYNITLSNIFRKVLLGALDRFVKPGKRGTNPLGSSLALFIGGALVIGTVLAATINLGDWIELGAGVEDTDACARTPITSFDQNFVSTANGDQSRITRISVEGIPVSCDGKYLRITVYNSNSAVLESVVWLLDQVNAGDTSISAIADGSTITNSSANNVSRIFPSSETNPLGLTLESLDPAAISSFELESSAEAITEN